MKENALGKYVYIVKPEYIKELSTELTEVNDIIGNMVISNVKKDDVSFALDVWTEPSFVTFDSISEAASILRAAGKYWMLNPIENVRRSHLILGECRKVPDLKRTFPIENELPEVGCFSLLDKNTMVYSVKRWKKWPLGQCQFVEDKKNPPNRAYLKLWEALSLLGSYPKQNESAFDLGASPGGWTYVMQSLGCNVTAIDKAELEPRIACLPRVSFLQQSAFAINPATVDKVDWLLGDIACYPDRLYKMTNEWIQAKKAKQIIFTIKLQGKTDIEMINKFQAIPNSRVINLFYNKHEATFFHPAPALLYPFGHE